MAVYTVDTTDDTVAAGDGRLSLREALARADATEAADTIRFAEGVQGGTIVLAGSQLTVNSDVTIDGGSGVTIDADERSRVLLVEGKETEVALAHLTITGGHTTRDDFTDGGGGIRGASYTVLMLDDVTVIGNRSDGSNAKGGGISGFSVSLSNSRVEGNNTLGEFASGGGIYAFIGSLTNSTVRSNHTDGTYAGAGGISGYDVRLRDSSVSGNRTRGDSAGGGGIRVEYLSLNASTVSDNSTSGDDADGGGISGYLIGLSNSTVSGNRTMGKSARGGGIYGWDSGDGGVHLYNSTVSDNRTEGRLAGGGGISGDWLVLTNSTITANRTAGAQANGGGISVVDDSGTLLTRNSIIAGNDTVRTGPDIAGSVTASNGSNIFGSDVVGDAPGDRENVPATQLFDGGLADHGGPTQTIALRDATDNPALGRADPDPELLADQRGVARPAPEGTGPDIGAFELDQSSTNPPPVGTTFVVTTTSDIAAGDGALTLREALALADAESSTSDRITFAPEVQGQTIVLGGGQLSINSDVTVDGGAGVTIDADQASRVLEIEGLDTTVALRNLTLTGGRTTDDGEGGGGIRADRFATLALDHVLIADNSTTGAGAQGGGIACYSLSMTASTVRGNSTTGDNAWGGGIYAAFDATLTNSTISGNRTQGNGSLGGGIAGFDVTLADSTVSENDAGGAGGGIRGDYVRLTNSTVGGNSAVGAGGGIHGASVSLVSSTISGNATTGNGFTTEYFHESAGGGGIYALAAVRLINSTVTGNRTGGLYAAGGGIGLREDEFRPEDLSVSNSIIAGNNAAASPGPDLAVGIHASNGHNIFGSDVEGSVAGDLENVPAGLLFAAMDPATGGGLLADHGGPTPTIALRDAPDNPALGGASAADAPATDQRGVARPLPGGTDPDIGAFEHPWLSRPADALEYIASYPDLVRALGPGAAAGEAHFRHYGAVEGRQVQFDGLEYIASYEDLLRQFGADRDAGAVHFIRYGLDAGRSTSFDGLEYVASHDDLITALGADADAGAVHFIRCGADEGRQPDDFDAEQYLANYADLQAAFGTDIEAATVHFIRYGHGEGRSDDPLPTQVAVDFLV